MGKKTKVGKQRKDVFYNLAKETGYRSRAAFKLIQLNRKFQFLEKTRVCVDLCAAPGGWLQVAQQNMPVSSLIIGFDLDAIKPIHNVQTFKCDITSEECRSILKKELKTWKVDTFLHDGAPNVGKSWDYDAYMQNVLTLSALKLATEFLMKGGYFVTKIFRSKDYNALIWVLNKLFRKVNATKPKASRSESAEIFVVCEDFLAPDFIDPKFFQPNFLFKDILDVDKLKKAKKEFLKPVQLQKKSKAEGYDDDSNVLYRKLNASEFIGAKNHVELLSRANEIVFDNEIYENDPLTKDNIKEYCRDIKLLSRKEILDLIKWQRKMRAKYVKEDEEDEVNEAADKVEEIADHEIETEESHMDKMLKKRKKRVLKEKQKLIQRMNMKMVHKDDELYAEDPGLFSISKLQETDNLDEMLNEIMDDDVANPNADDEQADMEEEMLKGLDKRILQRIDERKKVKYVEREAEDHLKEFDTVCPDSDEEEEDEFGNKIDRRTKERVKKIEGISKKMSQIGQKMEKVKLAHKGELNANQSDEESDALEYEDEDANIDHDSDNEKESKEKSNIFVPDFEAQNKVARAKLFFEQGLLKDANFDDDIELDFIDPKQQTKKSKAKVKETEQQPKPEEMYSESEDDTSDEEDDDNHKKKNRKNVKLDSNGLALGTLLVKSAKNRRDIMNEGWNRYTRGDEDLPDWFKSDEDKHFRKPVQVPENLVAEYDNKLAAINIRTCKKVAEAKARKKRRAMKVMEKLKKKTEAITENNEMTEREKVANIKRIYKKALKGNEKQKTTVIVARKGRNNMRRPRGVKGKYKVVDKRLKKDKRAEDRRSKKQKARRPPTRLAKKPKLAKDSDDF